MIESGRLFVFRFKKRVADFKRDRSFIEKADVNWPGTTRRPHTLALVKILLYATRRREREAYSQAEH